MNRLDLFAKVSDLLDIVDYDNEMIFDSPEEEEEVRTKLMEVQGILMP